MSKYSACRVSDGVVVAVGDDFKELLDRLFVLVPDRYELYHGDSLIGYAN